MVYCIASAQPARVCDVEEAMDRQADVRMIGWVSSIDERLRVSAGRERGDGAALLDPTDASAHGITYQAGLHLF